MSSGTLAEWGAGARDPKPPVSRGNTPWAEAYADEIEKLWKAHSARSPRTLQVHLGPSELGVSCHRQVAGKMAQLPPSNHVVDPWASIRGTALHAHAVEVFEWDNEERGLRWLTEQKVYPHDLHSGTLDLYDGVWKAIADHKFLAETSHSKVVKHGPPLHYFVQLLLYRLGLLRAGLEVERIVLLAYPADKSRMDNLYVWEKTPDKSDDELIEQVWEWTEYRRGWAAAIISGQATLSDVPADPEDDQCFFCPFYRPGLAHASDMGGTACSGAVAPKPKLRTP